MSDEVSDEVRLRMTAYWNLDSHLCARVAAGLGRGDGSTNGHASAAQAAEIVAGRANGA